jgi:hypothetical protein
MRVRDDDKRSGKASADSHKTGTENKELPRPASARSEGAGDLLSALRSGMRRIPTYAVGRAQERRRYIRVRLKIPLRVQRVAGQREIEERSLHTQDISSIGVYFLSPRLIEPGTPIELELLVVDHPFTHGTVRMRTEAHVVRADNTEQPGWHGLAAAFDDIRFLRDEDLPPRFQNP